MVARRRGNPSVVRKVRAPQRRVAGNSRPPRGEDQRHSDDVVGFGRRSETGKLYLEQGQIGGRNPACRGRGALPSPRVGRTSLRVTAGLRWMAIPAAASVVTGQNSAYRSPRWRTLDPQARLRWSATLSLRPDGRCGPPCSCCTHPSRHPDRRWGSGSSDPGRGTRRRTRVRLANRPGSAVETCIAECDAAPADRDPPLAA